MSEICETGYKGQKYKVVCKKEDGTEMNIGWTNDPSGGALVESVKLHPSLHSPEVIDLKK